MRKIEKNRKAKKKEGAGGGFTCEIEYPVSKEIQEGDIFDIDEIKRLKRINIREAEITMETAYDSNSEFISPVGVLDDIVWDLHSFYNEIDRYGGVLSDEDGDLVGEIEQLIFGEDIVSDAPSTLYHVSTTLRSFLPKSFPVKIGIVVNLPFRDSGQTDPYILSGKATFKPTPNLIQFVEDVQNSSDDDFYESAKSETITLPEDVTIDLGDREVILEKGERIEVMQENRVNYPTGQVVQAIIYEANEGYMKREIGKALGGMVTMAISVAIDRKALDRQDRQDIIEGMIEVLY